MNKTVNIILISFFFQGKKTDVIPLQKVNLGFDTGGVCIFTTALVHLVSLYWKSFLSPLVEGARGTDRGRGRGG